MPALPAQLLRFSDDGLLISGVPPRGIAPSRYFPILSPSLALSLSLSLSLSLALSRYFPNQGDAQCNQRTGINRAAFSSLIKPSDYQTELSDRSRCCWRLPRPQ